MDAFDTLSTLAQLALALAGFSSVTVAFRRAGESGEWLPEDAFRFRVMLRFSLGSAFLAALPAIASGFVADEVLLWRGLSVVMLLLIAESLVAMWRGAGPVVGRRLNLTVFILGLSSLGGASALQVLGALGVIEAQSAYVAAVGILAALAGLMFYRLTTIPIDAGRS